jgi:hypothetical protein
VFYLCFFHVFRGPPRCRHDACLLRVLRQGGVNAKGAEAKERVVVGQVGIFWMRVRPLLLDGSYIRKIIQMWCSPSMPRYRGPLLDDDDLVFYDLYIPEKKL